MTDDLFRNGSTPVLQHIRTTTRGFILCRSKKQKTVEFYLARADWLSFLLLINFWWHFPTNCELNFGCKTLSQLLVSIIGWLELISTWLNFEKCRELFKYFWLFSKTYRVFDSLSSSTARTEWTQLVEVMLSVLLLGSIGIETVMTY